MNGVKYPRKRIWTLF